MIQNDSFGDTRAYQLSVERLSCLHNSTNILTHSTYVHTYVLEYHDTYMLRFASRHMNALTKASPPTSRQRHASCVASRTIVARFKFRDSHRSYAVPCFTTMQTPLTSSSASVVAVTCCRTIHVTGSSQYLRRRSTAVQARAHKNTHPPPHAHTNTPSWLGLMNLLMDLAHKRPIANRAHDAEKRLHVNLSERTK